MNQITLLGRVGGTPETRSVGSTTVTEFSLATSERWKDKSGQQQERTDWHRAQIWGARGEAFARFHDKGDLALVSGSLHYREWQDKDGNKRTSAEVKVRDWHFAGGKKSDGGSRRSGGTPPSSAPSGGGGFSDDEIPFSQVRWPL